MYLIKPDWNKFKAKFSENPQSNFEWLCYLLFCKEYDKPFGIFRYKNQSGIETNPISKENEIIGWQAKFYETTLSDHKVDLIQTIIKANRDYPSITKVIFYTNQEWGQGNNQNDPQAKIDVEQKAKELDIEVEWRTASFFESTFVTSNNNIIAQHFFRLEKSIISIMKERQTHMESILCGIQTNIDFNNEKVEIDRSKYLENIKKELRQNQILIISGVGGVGKTALIKNLYTQLKSDIPFYVFKANEFNISKITDLINGFDLQEFIEAHVDEEMKIVVVDSSEKLIELNDTELFKEFLISLIKNNWRIIFTTRNNYLENLNYEFIEIHKITPLNINIGNLSTSELGDLSDKYKFLLPKDQKLIELIKNPFYLNEYLKFYKEEESIGYLSFKEKLWNKIIRKAKPSREQYFLQVAIQRANESQFFIRPASGFEILDEFVQDGILGYEEAGYFITHDIYEEWALEKIIQFEFNRKQTNKELFNVIGQSLPIRRSLRNWISEKLFLKNSSIKQFIEEVVQNDDIESFWKDEILVAVLLSDYSEAFFELFNDKLLENGQKLMKKLTFLLRIACKEIDNDFFELLGINDTNLLSIKYILTKPKGSGWESLLKFVYKNIDTIGINNLNFILPIIHDWNKKFKKGDTNKFSSLIALKYYQWTTKKDIYLSDHEESKEKLIQTILYGAAEIKEELITIFDEILKNKWKHLRDPYYDLVKFILVKQEDNFEVLKALPEYVLKLADLYWTETPQREDVFFHSSFGNAEYYGLEENYLDYYPSSSLQTPIYWLLRISLRETMEFILNFTKKVVEHFSKSSLGKNEIEEIDVYFENGETTKQYISQRLWNTFRATQASQHVFESIHMALEKFFLEVAETADSTVLESWLLYMLKNTNSASISAVVASIVLAFPEKTFNIAKILFGTKEFFLYDTGRMLGDQTAKSLFSIGYGLYYENKLHQDERIKTCDDRHRKNSIENLALTYQFFRSEHTSEEESKKRLLAIYNILDRYYEELNSKTNETELDKTWRLYLARIDRRKMSPKAEEKDGQIIIDFNPQIDPELKEFSEASINKSSELMKHSTLKIWSSYKMSNDSRCKQYEQYNNNPKLVLDEVKEIIEGFNKTKDRDYFLFNNSIPGEACSVLIRDYYDELLEEDKIFCKNIILKVALLSYNESYTYQIGDGIESAISVLPILLKQFPEEREEIKGILLLTLFDNQSIGMYCEFCDYAKKAIIKDLWNICFDDAQSLLMGYLLLKPKYDELGTRLRKDNYKKQIFELREYQIVKEFVQTYESDIQEVIDNKISIVDIKDIEKLDLYILKTAFELIPIKTNNVEHKAIAQKIITTFAKKLLLERREDKVDYKVKHDFLEKLANFTLNSSEHDIYIYMRPFIENFNNSETVVDLFKTLISAEDSLETYSNFWYIWDLFYDNVITLCDSNRTSWYTDEVIISYLFAKNLWRGETIEWHTLKEMNKTFFKKIAENIGDYPPVIYSITKLLNGIGSIYINDGVLWISTMLRNNKNLWSDKLNEYTVYYLENVIKKYIYMNREVIRKTTQLKQAVLTILDFLIVKGSVIGYLLRENIL